MRAARREHARVAHVDGIGHLAGDRDEPAARGVVVELAGEQRARVRMARGAEDFGHGTGLDDRAAVHDAEVVAELGDEAEMVRDEDDRAGEAAAQVLQQRHDLRFDRRVERRRGLVGEQQIGLDQERHGDHHALAHAARELVRIGGEPQRRIGDADARERRDRAPLARRPAAIPGWRRRSTSTRCVPTVKSGFSAVIGSWKIIAIRVPR